MLGTRLKQLRESVGKSKKEVAIDFKVHESTYGKYELGKREPSIEDLQRLADYFKVSTDYLLGKSDIPTTVSMFKMAAKFFDGASYRGLREDWGDDALQEMAVILNTTVDELLSIPDDPFRAIVDPFYGLSDADKQEVLDFIEFKRNRRTSRHP